MNNQEIQTMIDRMEEASFVTNNDGEIIAWNSAAEQLFSIASDKAIGQYCDEIINGVNNNRPICTLDCAIQQAARQHCQICDFKLQISTAQGRQWVTMSVLIFGVADQQFPYLVHTARLI